MSVRSKNPVSLWSLAPMASLEAAVPLADAAGPLAVQRADQAIPPHHNDPADRHLNNPTAHRASRFATAQEFIDRFKPRDARRLFRVYKSDLDEIVSAASECFDESSEVFDNGAIYYGIADDILTLLDGMRVVERVPKSLYGLRLAAESMILMEKGNGYIEIPNPGRVLKNGKPYLFYVHKWQFRLIDDSHAAWSLWKRSLDEEGPDVPPRYIVLRIDGQTAEPIDPEITFFDSDGSQITCYRNELYRPTGLPFSTQRPVILKVYSTEINSSPSTIVRQAMKGGIILATASSASGLRRTMRVRC
jgi:hypothetical protein